MISRAARRYSTQLECSLEKIADIHVITLDRPQARNALGRTLLSQFRSCLDTVASDQAARVLIIKSAVPKVFCAGADLKERVGMTSAQTQVFVKSLRQAFTDLENIPVPTICCIDGFALGGGLEMALGADIRIAGHHAKMGLVETQLAIIPGLFLLI